MHGLSAEDLALLKDIPEDALYETWDSVYDKSQRLSAKIQQHCHETGERFDSIIVIPRGSYYPANIVSRELNFRAIDLLHACIDSYPSGKADGAPTLKVGQMPPKELVEGKDLLIVEEVCDTGRTLSYVVDYLRENGAHSVRTGVLHYKSIRNETGFKPDWFITETDKWIVYPWEVNERRGLHAKVRRS